MHEFSIVQSLLSLIESYAKKENAKSVEKVVVLIGPLSGVEPHLLKMAFDTLKEGTVASNAEILMEEVPLKVYCHHCRKEFYKKELNILCPVCNQPSSLVSGDELYLKSMEMEI